jgi:hypothetical protein
VGAGGDHACCARCVSKLWKLKGGSGIPAAGQRLEASSTFQTLERLQLLAHNTGEFALADFEDHAVGGRDDGFDVSDGFVVELYPALLDEAAGFAG